MGEVSNTVPAFLGSCWHFAHLCTGKWEIIPTNRFTVFFFFFWPLVLPFVSWEPRKTWALTKKKKSFQVHQYTLYTRSVFLFHSLSFSHSCSCFFFLWQAPHQHCYMQQESIQSVHLRKDSHSEFLPIRTMWHSRKQAALSESVCLHHLGINMRHFHTRNLLNCTKIAFSRCNSHKQWLFILAPFFCFLHQHWRQTKHFLNCCTSSYAKL